MSWFLVYSSLMFLSRLPKKLGRLSVEYALTEVHMGDWAAPDHVEGGNEQVTAAGHDPRLLIRVPLAAPATEAVLMKTGRR